MARQDYKMSFSTGGLFLNESLEVARLHLEGEPWEQTILRAAETLPLSERDEQTRIGYLERLERKRWSGPELNDFEVDLALEIDIFFHGIGDYLPVSFFDQRKMSFSAF